MNYDTPILKFSLVIGNSFLSSSVVSTKSKRAKIRQFPELTTKHQKNLFEQSTAIAN